MKKKVAIFASGTGSNFERIADDARLAEWMEIAVLVCDQPQATVIEKAHQRQIATYVFSARDFSDKQAYEQAILTRVADCDFIFLAGYMRLLSPYFLAQYAKPILNIHPSLLPAYKGKDAIQQAYQAGEQRLGISIHYVNEEMDGGEVIAQATLERLPDETLAEVTARIHQLEHQLYPEVILEHVKGDNK